MWSGDGPQKSRPGRYRLSLLRDLDHHHAVWLDLCLKAASEAAEVSPLPEIADQGLAAGEDADVFPWHRDGALLAAAVEQNYGA